jgi:hypothetical protein
MVFRAEQSTRKGLFVKGNISISRVTSGGHDWIEIRIGDDASRIEFVEAKIEMEEYARLISGLSHQPCEIEVRGVNHIGKRKVSESRTAVAKIDTLGRKELQQWLIDNCQEEGWILDPYLGSQGSISRNDGKLLLRYSVYKFVEE